MNENSSADFDGGMEAGASEVENGIWSPPELREMEGQLHGYEFRSLIGRGGMGAVYKAWQTSLDRAVAVKVLSVQQSTDLDYASRFKQEAKTMARLSHPGIVSVYDAGETSSGLLYFVMEFIAGTDVSQMLLVKTRLPAEHALAITAHVCDALAYAHKHGVVHRDIKPANIMVSQEGIVKVADFGLAKLALDVESGMETVTMGTPDFVAPEALILGVEPDHRADLYAVGVMLYNMLTGEIPREGFQLPSHLTDCDPRFDQIVVKAMQPDREDRFQSAEEIRSALNEILTGPLQKAIPVAQRVNHGTARAGATARHSLRATGKHSVQMAVQADMKGTGRHAVGQAGRPAVHALRNHGVSHPEKKKAPIMAFVLVLAGVAAASSVWYATVTKKTQDDFTSPLVVEVEQEETAPHAETANVEPSPQQGDDSDDFLVPEITVQEVTPPKLPEGVVDFQGSRYQFILEEKNWDDAKAQAESMGGHLAVITTKEEQNWIRQTFMAPYNRDGGFWLGARAEKRNEWQWVTGEKWNGKGWAKGEPDYDKGGDVWYLAFAQHRGGRDRAWHDSIGKGHMAKKPFLVEWSEAGRLALEDTKSVEKPQEPQTPTEKSPPNKAVAPHSTVAEISALQQRMEALTEERVNQVYDAAILDLNNKYTAALERENTTTQGAGDDKMTQALQNEVALVAGGTDISSQGDTGLPDKMVAMRTVYRSARQQIEKTRTDNETLLKQQYVTALQQLEAKFLAENRSNDVGEVRSLLSDLNIASASSSLVSLTPTPAPAPATSQVPASNPMPAAADSLNREASGPPGDGTHGKEITEWVTLRKGKVTVLVNGKERVFTELDKDKLPDGDYKIIRLFNNDAQANHDFPLEWLEGQTELVSIELNNFPIALKPWVLRGMKNLTSFSMRQTSPLGREMAIWSDDSLAALPSLPALTDLSIPYSSLTEKGVMSLQAQVPKLKRMTMAGVSLTMEMVGAMRGFSELVEVTLRQAEIQPGALEGFKSVRNLQRLEFNASKMDFTELSHLPDIPWIVFSGESIASDENAVTIITSVPPGIKRLHLNDSKMQGSALQSLTRLRELKRLDLVNNRYINNVGLSNLPVMDNLEVLLLNGCRELNSDAGAELIKHKGLRELQLRDVRDFGDYGLTTLCSELQNLRYLFLQNTSVSDEGLEKLKELKKLQTLGIGGPKMTANALSIVSKLPELKSLMIDGPVDAASLAAFRKARPDVNVRLNERL